MLIFEVPGRARPESKQFVAFLGNDGKITRRRADKPHILQWKSTVAMFAKAAVDEQGWEISEEPLAVFVSFFDAKPQSYRKKDAYPYRRPDIENKVKPFLDACTGIIWPDDARIVMLCMAKIFGIDDRVMVSVQTMSDHIAGLGDETE